MNLAEQVLTTANIPATSTTTPRSDGASTSSPELEVLVTWAHLPSPASRREDDR